MLGMGMNVANIIIIISYFTIEGSYLKQIYMVLHDTYIGYMISLSFVEILKYVFFFLGLQSTHLCHPNYHQEQDH
jgi:hypothetical protein